MHRCEADLRGLLQVAGWVWRMARRRLFRAQLRTLAQWRPLKSLDDS